MKKRKKMVVIISSVVLAIAMASPFLFKLKNRPETPDPSKQSPEQIAEYVRSDEFRSLDHQSRRNYMHRAFGQMMEQTIEKYSSLPSQQRTAFLDKVIDDMQAGHRQFEAVRRQPPTESDQQQPQTGSEVRQGHEGAAQEDRGTRTREGRDVWDRGGQGRSFRGVRPERIRSMAESISPKRRAQYTEFMQALGERMRERGIDFFRGPGPR